MRVIIFRFVFILIAAFLLTLSWACQDEVDQSDMYTFKGETALDFMQNSKRLSSYVYLLGRTQISSKSRSAVAELLSARGNYTVFAPTNEAIQVFLDSLYGTKGFDVSLTPDSTAQFIVYNSIIDNGIGHAYLTTDFQVGALNCTNFDDRYIQVSYANEEDGSLRTLVNERSSILSPDNEVSNGVVHVIDCVIDLSRASLADLIKNTPNLQIFSRLLQLTHLNDSISAYRDEDYESYHIPEGSIDWGNGLNVGAKGPSPEHRYFGYTAFVETDSVFVEKWGLPEPEYDKQGVILNLEEIVEVIVERCGEAYPLAKGSDFTRDDNALHQFMSYHLLPERLTWQNIVVHHNEMGYASAYPEALTIECYEYYEAISRPRRLIKIVEGGSSKGKRINRHCLYDNSLFGDYHVLSCDREGILIKNENQGFSNNALNGFYYPIDDILLYDDDVPNKVLNERLRFDFASICPELMTNGLRQAHTNDWYYIPPGYISTFSFDVNTAWRYVPYFTGREFNWQSDEISIAGQYDFVFRLPPVPYEGTWEVRMCSPHVAHFGMFQIYLGTNPKSLPAIGLPLDFRLRSSNPNIGWSYGDPNNLEEQQEIDKNMRLHGYMKNNMHNGQPAPGGVVTTPLRQNNGDYIRMRKIIWTGTMSPQKTYYVRIKSVLENTSTCCMLDYFEFCPKSVFNGSEPEDPW